MIELGYPTPGDPLGHVLAGSAVPAAVGAEDGSTLHPPVPGCRSGCRDDHVACVGYP